MSATGQREIIYIPCLGKNLNPGVFSGAVLSIILFKLCMMITSVERYMFLPVAKYDLSDLTGGVRRAAEVAVAYPRLPSLGSLC